MTAARKPPHVRKLRAIGACEEFIQYAATKPSLILAILFLAALPASAGTIGESLVTVSRLPHCTRAMDNVVFVVTDGAVVGDTDIGGGAQAFMVWCEAVSGEWITTTVSVTTPDGRHRVEVCDCYRHQVYEIRARLEPDGPWYHVGAQVPALQDVRNDLVVTNDRVVWVQGETASGSNFALRSSPIDVPNFSTVISHRPAQSGVGFDFPIEKISGDRVRFRSDPFVDESFAWYVTPIGGGAIQQEIFADGFENGGRARWQ